MSNHEHITILEAGRAEKNYWRDLWRYRANPKDGKKISQI